MFGSTTRSTTLLLPSGPAADSRIMDKESGDVVTWDTQIAESDARFCILPAPIFRSRRLGWIAKGVMMEVLLAGRLVGPRCVSVRIKTSTLVDTLRVHQTTISEGIRELISVGLLARHKKNGEFTLPDPLLTYDTLFKLWPSTIDNKDVRTNLLALMLETPELVQYIPKFFKESSLQASFHPRIKRTGLGIKSTGLILRPLKIVN